MSAREIFRVSACALTPALLTLSAETLRHNGNLIGRICSYVPIASTPYVFELSIVYCALTIFNEIRNGYHSHEKRTGLILCTQQMIIFSASVAFVTLISPSIKLGEFEMGHIDHLTTLKCTLLTGIVEFALSFFKITPHFDSNPFEILIPPPSTIQKKKHPIAKPGPVATSNQNLSSSDSKKSKPGRSSSPASANSSIPDTPLDEGKFWHIAYNQ